MKKSDVFVYIAGKYTDEDMLSTELNIAEAQKLAIQCAKLGIHYFCPHTHSRLMDYYAPEVPYEYWMTSGMRTLSSLCNCVLMVSNYKDSKGSKEEEMKAKDLGYPIFYSLNDLKKWYSLLED